MFISRNILTEVKRRLAEDYAKIIVIYGARQVGKTTLVEKLLEEFQDKQILSIDGDSFKYRNILSSSDPDKLAELVAGKDLIFIDEAQRIENIGINLKIMYDKFRNLKIIVTGSSAFDLANKVKEPLTGRTYTYRLYPISFLELQNQQNSFELKEQLEQRLIYGSYPNLLSIKNNNDKKEYLNNLVADYLYRDVLEFQNIKHSNKLKDLLLLLAFQIGSEVSFHELGKKLNMSRLTVESYINLLEQAFVVFTLRGFSRNLRKEVNKKPKIYFYDLGIRNALINNFAHLDLREDTGKLWENFLVVERLKRNEYKRYFCNKYFWRTYTGAELDYIEEYDGNLYGYEFKWQKTAKAPQAWLENYSKEFATINKDNFLDFVLST